MFRQLDAPESDQPEHALTEFEQRRRLQIALEELPEEQRVAFLLRIESGLGLDEIGEITGAGRRIAALRTATGGRRRRQSPGSIEGGAQTARREQTRVATDAK